VIAAASSATWGRVPWKQKQANESKIAFICFHLFFRIGTFQRVTPEKNKKFGAVSTRL
jgi:hypothetical protein